MTCVQGWATAAAVHESGLQLRPYDMEGRLVPSLSQHQPAVCGGIMLSICLAEGGCGQLHCWVL